MSRWPRMVAPGVAVHVIQRGNNRQPIFFASDDYDKFLEDLGVTSQAYSCEIHAYVLMTNHVHLLLTPKIAGAVSPMMQALGRTLRALYQWNVSAFWHPLGGAISLISGRYG